MRRRFYLFAVEAEIFQKQRKLPSSYKRIQESRNSFKTPITSLLLIFPGSRFLFHDLHDGKQLLFVGLLHKHD